MSEMNETTKKTIDASKVIGIFHVFQEVEPSGWQRNADFYKIIIESDPVSNAVPTVRVNGRIIPNPVFKDDTVSWDSGSFANVVKGDLKITSGYGYEIEGEIVQGKKVETGKRYKIVGFTAPPATYKLYVSKNSFAESDKNLTGAPDSTEWISLGELQFAFDFDTALSRPAVQIALNGSEVKPEIMPLADPPNLWRFTLVGIMSQQLNETLNIDLVADGRHFLGSEKSFARIAETKDVRYVNIVQIGEEASELVSFPQVETTNTEINRQSDELASTIISLNKIGETVQSLIIRNMKWAVGKEPNSNWLQRLTGETPPSLDAAQSQIAAKSEDWYRNILSKALFTSSINTISNEKILRTHLSDEEKNKLSYFIKNRIHLSPSYLAQAYALAPEATITSYPNLQKYTGHDAEQWAMRLFNRWTRRDALYNLITKISNSTEKGMEELRSKTQLLSFLQPSQELEVRFYNMVLHGFIAVSMDSVQVTDKEYLRQWIVDAVDQMLLMYGNGTLRFEGQSIDAKALRELREVLTDKTQDAYHAFNEFLQMMIGKPLLITLENQDFVLQSRQFLEKYPKWNLFFRISGFILSAFAVYESASTLFSWNDLTGLQRTKAIAQVIYALSLLTLTADASYVSIIKPKLLSNDGIAALQSVTDVIVPENIELAAHLRQNFDDIYKQASNAARNAENMRLEQMKWYERTFAEGRVLGLVRGFGAVAIIFITVCDAINSVGKITDSNKPTGDRIAEGIQFTLSTCVNILFLLDILAISELCLPLGMAGMAIMVIYGVVRDKFFPDDSDVELYMKQVGKPFLSSIDYDTKLRDLLNAGNIEKALDFARKNAKNGEVLLSISRVSDIDDEMKNSKGTLFFDFPGWGARFSGLTVYLGDVADAIEAIYTGGSGNAKKWGGTGGAGKTLSFADDEVVIEISGETGDYFGARHILGLTIKTTKNSYEFKGTKANASNVRSFAISAGPKEKIYSLLGKSYRHMDGTEYLFALGAAFSPYS